MATRVKICGVTTEQQARAIAEIGVDAIGVNFVPGSPRLVDDETARAIARAVGDKVLVVAVVAGMGVEHMQRLGERTGARCLQLHGSEPDEVLERLLPHAYKAVRIAGPDDVARAEHVPGEYVMVDAKVGGRGAALGGTGHTFDWELVVGLAHRRRVVLAGGLRPENVAAAVTRVRPYCVDVASGVESAPGIKDMVRVRAFVEAVRGVPPL